MTNTSSDKSLAKKLPRAKPLNLTFYDVLGNYPYTSTFYVRDDATLNEIESLIQSVAALSSCVLGKYKIGHEEYIIPNRHNKIKELSRSVMGTFKWRVVYYTEDFKKHSVTIPGRDNETSLRTTKGMMKKLGKMPDLSHPKWQTFIANFRSICVTKTGQTILDQIEGDITGSSWPPKGAKKRR